MIPLDPQARPRLARRARLRWDPRARRHLLLYPERGLELDDNAAAIVHLCDGTRRIAEIAGELHRAHPHDELARIERDVTAFLDALRSRGLIE